MQLCMQQYAAVCSSVALSRRREFDKPKRACKASEIMTMVPETVFLLGYQATTYLHAHTLASARPPFAVLRCNKNCRWFNVVVTGPVGRDATTTSHGSWEQKLVQNNVIGRLVPSLYMGNASDAL